MGQRLVPSLLLCSDLTVTMAVFAKPPSELIFQPLAVLPESLSELTFRPFPWTNRVLFAQTLHDYL